MLNLEKINALAELERCGIKYEPAGDEEVRILCPLHEDTKPSCSLNIVKNLWICHAASCKKTGDIVSLLAYTLNTDRKTVLADLLTRYPDIEAVKTVRQDIIEEWHQKIWKSGPFLKELYNRGLIDNDIREFRLGFHDGRITIPIPDLKGRFINVRKYLPGAPGPEKFRNTKGYTAMALFPIEQLKYPTIWVCGGEMKAIVVKRLLNPHNIGAVTVTAGEGNWDASFTPLFKDKQVYICMDIDAGGKAASKSVGNLLCRVAASTNLIDLPLDRVKYPKGDVNDYVGHENATDKELLECMTRAVRYAQASVTVEDQSPPISCKLIEAARANYVGKRLNFNAIIVALDEVPFLVPKEVDVTCRKDGGGLCTSCPVYPEDPNEDTGEVRVKVPSTSPGIINLTASPNGDGSLNFALNMPFCKSAEFHVRTYYNIFDSRLSTPLEFSGDNKENTIQPAFLVCDRLLDMNLPYKMSGRPFAHPKTAQATLVVDGIIEKEDNLSNLEFTQQDAERLKIFQPEDWSLEKLTDKINHIANDLATNVTRIFKRPDLHIGIDMIYHSVLYFPFDGRIQHGWANCLITGDSSQGKSEATIRLIEHYGLGTRHDCKNASEAGLLGGLQQLGTRWFISWGVIPIHDKQLVIMEEIKGANETVLGKLTDMRSSGFAEITKIERRKAHARTRLIMISNPRGDKPVSAYSFGVEIIRELMGTPEDVRRFDFALILSEREIKAGEVNRLAMETDRGDPYYSADFCKRLILWSWTRKSEDIEFEPESRQLCLKYSIDLCNEFTETLPLCDKGTTRYKIARLAIALACRTFSTIDGKKVIVRPCHVQYINEFLRRNYTLPHFGYKDFTEAERYTNEIRDPDVVRRRIKTTKFPRDLVEQLLHSESIVLNDICDWCEVPRELGQGILSLLVRKRALHRTGNVYEKASGFITLLKKMLTEDDLKDNVDEKAEF